MPNSRDFGVSGNLRLRFSKIPENLEKSEKNDFKSHEVINIK